MHKKVTIQGYEGSFHQVAARQFFGKNVEVIPCATFREVVQIGEDAKQSDGGVMAIENSIAGSILPNYNLLQKSKLQVIGEVYLSISQNLLVYPGVKLDEIKDDPQVLICGQCLSYSDTAAKTYCEKHGQDFIIYKCYYCCKQAIYICAGPRRYCEQCHTPTAKIKACEGFEKCEFKGFHPPNG